MDSAERAGSNKRRRTEHTKRSKLGCRTCLGKRVKCDERHPRCGRCERLDLDCEWANAPTPPLSSRRRGYGPIKARDNWTPRAISPKSVAACDDIPPEDSFGRPPAICDDPGDMDMENAFVFQPGEAGTDQSLGRRLSSSVNTFRQLLASSTFVHVNDEMALVPLMRQSAGPRSDAVEEAWRTDLEESLTPEQTRHTSLDMQAPLPTSILDSWQIFHDRTASISMPSAFPPTITVKDSDVQAVTFHRVVFAPLKSTRTSALSAHSIFLDRALTNTMAMHFLLAVSHSELAIYQGQGVRMPQTSWQHFHRGSQLLFGTGDSFTHHVDHVGMLLSFLYMYMFWMRRDPFNLPIIRELSRSVLSYVKIHGLDDLRETGSFFASEQVLLCRILTYLYDRDGFCYFFGCGGAFASYVNDNPEKRRRIWQLSQRCFPWTGSLVQPSNLVSQRVTTDVQDAGVTEIYFQLISIHHDINCYSQTECGQQTKGLESKIRSNIERVEKEQQVLFDLVADQGTGQGSGPPSLMALVTVAFYYALLVYFYHSRDILFGQLPVPGKLQKALSDLVRTAFNTVATGPVQLLERFQWALLIAGIETHDPVHREWVIKNLADHGMKNALLLVLDTMRRYGGCISMKEIRQLVSTVSLFST